MLVYNASYFPLVFGSHIFCSTVSVFVCRQVSRCFLNYKIIALAHKGYRHSSVQMLVLIVVLYSTDYNKTVYTIYYWIVGERECTRKIRSTYNFTVCTVWDIEKSSFECTRRACSTHQLFMKVKATYSKCRHSEKYSSEGQTIISLKLVLNVRIKSWWTTTYLRETKCESYVLVYMKLTSQLQDSVNYLYTIQI